MNCIYENYLYIYNIKLIKENILLIKKITFKFVFCIIFINSIKHVFLIFFLEQKPSYRIQFPNTIFFFFLKTQKTFLKNYSQKLFFRTVLKNNSQTSPYFS